MGIQMCLQPPEVSAQEAPSKRPGLQEPASSERVAQLLCACSPLLVVSFPLLLQIGKYYVALSEFERVAIPQLTPSKRIKLHIIDEVSNSPPRAHLSVTLPVT